MAELSRSQEQALGENWEQLVEDDVDSMFPHRDADDKPAYRLHQRETILKIIMAFLVNKKRFVTLDGPVGCGKSAINYTVARILENAVYLTPQKQLQDQIAREHWTAVKMIKGKSSYCCNHVGQDNHNIRCTYNGERYHMCNNSSSSYRATSATEDRVIRFVEETIERFHNDERVFRMRTGFEPNDDLPQVCNRIREWVCNDDMRRGTTTKYPIYYAVGCSMGPKECPVRSTRMLAKIAGIKLLNPDIFFLLNLGIEPYFPNNNLMVIDECHTLEGVIQRIFGVKLPLDTIKELFGLDITDLFNCDTSADFAEKYIYSVKTYLGPIIAAANTISRLGDVCRVTNYDSLQEMKSQNEFAIALRTRSNAILQHRGEISILEVANHAFMDSDKPVEPEFLTGFRDLVRIYFLEQCAKYGCEQKIDIFDELVPACERFYNHIGWDPGMNFDRQVANHIISLKKALDSFLDNVSILVSIKNGDYESFVLGKDAHANTRYVCAGTELESVAKQYYDFNHTDRCIEVVPIAVGALLKTFFYSKAEHVLLSTGTWVDLKGTLKVYGIPAEDVEYIRIPSTFEARRRPVYVLSNKRYTDFSQKTQKSGYVYKTPEGTKKFCAEFSGLVERVREYIAKKHKGAMNINIVVHCHTFDIARKIAEFAPIIDNSFLIHLAQGSMPIRNAVTGYKTEYVHKDELLEHLNHHPNSGLTLISASVSEGVDFKYGIARVQILLKRPTPYLGSPYVSAYYRGNEEVGIPKDPNYLDRVTFTETTQQYGRVMRAQDDWGYTIIFDQALAKSLYHLLSARSEFRVRDLNLSYFAQGVKGGRDMRGLAFFDWPFG